MEVQSSSVKYDIWQMKHLEDQILVRRVLEADPESFGELCRRYYQSLVAVADSILMDHHLAEDAVTFAIPRVTTLAMVAIETEAQAIPEALRESASAANGFRPA